jgi:hypothetical protein
MLGTNSLYTSVKYLYIIYSLYCVLVCMTILPKGAQVTSIYPWWKRSRQSVLHDQRRDQAESVLRSRQAKVELMFCIFNIDIVYIACNYNL